MKVNRDFPEKRNLLSIYICESLEEVSSDSVNTLLVGQGQGELSDAGEVKASS